MAEEEKFDPRCVFLKEKIAAGFPKLAGSKLDKLLATDEVRYGTKDVGDVVMTLLGMGC